MSQVSVSVLRPDPSINYTVQYIPVDLNVLELLIVMIKRIKRGDKRRRRRRRKEMVIYDRRGEKQVKV
jgi:hypothetical protein